MKKWSLGSSSAQGVTNLPIGVEVGTFPFSGVSCAEAWMNFTERCMFLMDG